MKYGQLGWARAGTLTLVSVSLLAVGCVVSTERSTEGAGASAAENPSCQADVRNDEWDIDCSVACNHVLACKESTGDSDLQSLTCGDCLGSCVAGVPLGGNDLVESTEEDRRAWECAVLVEGCSALDHNCDLY